jgi:hypothetical protein
MNKFISYATAFLVLLLGIGSFILSYNALQGVALENGLSQNLSYVWPLLVDFALIVFSLAVVQSNLNNEPAGWRWAMVGLYTVATVAFNVYHAPANLAAQIVAVVAPVSLFLSFETLMSMLKKSVSKKALVLSLAQITAKMKELEGLYRAKEDNLETELKRLERERLAEIEANRLRLTDEIGQLESQLSQLQEEITAKANTLNSYTQDVEAKKQELKGLTGGLTKTYLPANLTLEQKQDLANQMANDGLTNEQVATALGVSLASVKNYKKANRLMADPADIPVTTGGQNGNHRKAG